MDTHTSRFDDREDEALEASIFSMKWKMKSSFKGDRDRTGFGG